MKLHHIALVSSDINRSIEWYQKHIEDINILYKDDSWALINCANTKIAFVRKDQHPTHICFTIDETTKNKKVPNKKFKQHRDGTSYCYISDPDGNFIEYLLEK